VRQHDSLFSYRKANTRDRLEVIPELSKIWHEVLGKIWMPEIGIEEIESSNYEELNRDMPLTYIALYGEICVFLHIAIDHKSLVI